jgi:capsular polysaccharide export protein
LSASVNLWRERTVIPLTKQPLRVAVEVCSVFTYDQSMNIVITLYYIDFARYFLYLRDAIKVLDETIEFTFVSFYPSAHHYLKRRNVESLFLPDLLKKAKPAAGDFEAMISYQQKLMPHLDQSLLLDEVARCVTVFDDLLSQSETSLLISSGDTRMQSEAAIGGARHKAIPVLYFEQGAFGTTIFDHKGVNANVSFRGQSLPDSDDPVDLAQIERYRQGNKAGSYDDDYTFMDRLIEKLDLVWLYPLPGCSNRLPYYCQTGESFLDLAKIRISQKLKDDVPVALPTRYVLLPLQMPIDAQILYHSPLYSSFSQVIEDVAQALPDGYVLVVREHPNYRGRYGREVYEVADQLDSVVIINDSNLQQTLLKAEAIAVINSSVGIEAISYHKKVLLLGDAYYENASVLTKLEHRDKMKETLHHLLMTPVDREGIDQHLSNLLHRHLLPGHFRDATLTGGPLIANKILEHINTRGEQP